MEFLLKFVLIWWAAGVIVGVTGWLAAVIVKPRYPGWWRRVVADDDPYELAAKRTPKIIGPYRPRTIIVSLHEPRASNRVARKPILSSSAFQSGRKQSDVL